MFSKLSSTKLQCWAICLNSLFELKIINVTRQIPRSDETNYRRKFFHIFFLLLSNSFHLEKHECVKLSLTTHKCNFSFSNIKFFFFTFVYVEWWSRLIIFWWWPAAFIAAKIYTMHFGSFDIHIAFLDTDEKMLILVIDKLTTIC